MGLLVVAAATLFASTVFAQSYYEPQQPVIAAKRTVLDLDAVTSRPRLGQRPEAAAQRA